MNKTGVLNIRKEKNYTSHDVVAIIRRLTGGKTGHTGTLDPDAMGVLPICLGRATKLADYLSAEDKTYVAEIVLGITTDTGDMSGEILSQKDADIKLEQLQEVAESFLYEKRGEYLQTPPMYSAVKIGGKKLYELARKGETIERPARPVKILDIKIVSGFETYTEPNAHLIDEKRLCRCRFEVTCSKGTYIRSLCMDIGEVLGCGATMGELTRTRSGSFHIDNSFTLAEVKSAVEEGRLGELILRVDEILPYPVFRIKPEGLARARNGNPIPFELVEEVALRREPRDLAFDDAEAIQSITEELRARDDWGKVDGRYWLYSAVDNKLMGLYSFSSKKGNFCLEVLF
ncbi:MAG: tRNA pseudouridine(55) synthase TruB [Defluviitaleaceae bacterium]|nr:tRNA pseudouridine(55) synthase TruB [Defluviitaleaceae bacterium]